MSTRFSCAKTLCCAGVRQRTVTQGLPAINLEPHEGKLLQLIVRLCGARRVIEIGTLAGFTAPSGSLAACRPTAGSSASRRAKTHANVARENLTQARFKTTGARVMQGEGLPMLRKLADDAPYDLLFIDADKVQLSGLPGLGGGESADWAGVVRGA